MSSSHTPSLVVIVRPEARVRAHTHSVKAASESVADAMSAALQKAGATIRPLFGESEDRLAARAASVPPSMGRADLHLYYEVAAPPDAGDDALAALQQELAAMPHIEGAYLAPRPVPASVIEEDLVAPDEPINRMLAAPAEAPPTTADFTARQGYLEASPQGIDARFAWTRPGGRGAGVNIIDCEGAWRFSHEDLRTNQGGVIGPQTNDLGWRNHGTAVAGEIGADVNGFGVTGICPDAIVRGSSIFGPGGLPAAIRAAADRLSPGDIILLEVQYGHPGLGYTAVEWWPADHAAIRYAVGRGVIVVEAAGNGGNDLDNPVYDQPLAGFPATWSNPFRRGAADSGAIVVGAGAPPPGTHGRDHGPDRSRLGFSNFGALVDVQGWGREVTTAGYGDLQGGTDEDLWYTDQFSGTSSASPIVVGALGCIQGILRAHSRQLLTPQGARQLLRSSGAPQTDAPNRPRSQRIGNRPNLRELVDRVLPSRVSTVPLFRYYHAQRIDHFYTTNWSELGGGAHGWGYEGVQCYILPQSIPGAVPLYRYWNPVIVDHFYTTSWAELGSGNHGWRYEGIQGYVMPHQVAGTVPLYRYWGNGDHFYTTNWNELGGGRHGWGYEGIQCYVYTAAVTPPDAPSTDAPHEAMASLGALMPALAAGLPEGAPRPFAEKARRLGATDGAPLEQAEPIVGSFEIRASEPPGASSFRVEAPQQQRSSNGVTITIKVDAGE